MTDQLPRRLLHVGRQWVLANIDGADAMPLSPPAVRQLIDRHYVTGLGGFVRDTRQ